MVLVEVMVYMDNNHKDQHVSVITGELDLKVEEEALTVATDIQDTGDKTTAFKKVIVLEVPYYS